MHVLKPISDILLLGLVPPAPLNTVWKSFCFNISAFKVHRAFRIYNQLWTDFFLYFYVFISRLSDSRIDSNRISESLMHLSVGTSTTVGKIFSKFSFRSYFFGGGGKFLERVINTERSKVARCSVTHWYSISSGFEFR
jgi:hypothetical protein